MRTALTRWTPTADLFRDRMSRFIDEAFNDFVSPGLSLEAASTRPWMPAVDIEETGDSLNLYVEIPGLTKDDVQLTLENNVLTISGERTFDQERKGSNYHRVERAYGKFSRAFSLPTNVDAEKVKASFEHGILAVTLPKTDAAKPRRISIR